MTEPLATVEPNGQNAASLRATEAGAAASAPQGGRFAYPSGSTPLEGFTIKRGVGHGGFGEVYYALSDAGKEVALKLIRRNLDVELRGIRHCLNLKHPNLLSVFDIRHDQTGDNWVVMEFVTGQSLEEAISAHPRGMPPEEALAWLFGIGAGVACLHDHGVVHRDLKPGNVFSDEGVVKLGDYGLSKFISCSRRSGHTESVGTVHYMAPEIANGRYGKEIDIYALGVILYEMLTGRVPFEGESVGEVLMKHLTTPPDVSMLAEPFRSVVAKAMEKDPAKRFGAVTEMLAALPRPAHAEVHIGPFPTGATRHRPEFDSGGPAGPAAPAGAAGGAGIGDEPIYRAARRLWRRGSDAWHESKVNTTAKAILLVVLGVVLVKGAGSILPALGIMLMLYACYFTVRAFVLAHQARKQSRGAWEKATPAQAPTRVPPPVPAASSGGAAPPTGQTATWVPGEARPRWAPRPLGKREQLVELLRQRSPRQRIAELLGSLLGSSVVAVVTSLVVPVLFSFSTPQSGPGLWGIEDWARYVWLALVTIAGTWGILIASKLWEGTSGDAMLRRFILMVIGLGVGIAAVAAASFLGVDVPHARDSEIFQPQPHHFDRTIHGENPWSALKYSMAAFGALFALIRWWHSADPLRSTRLSLWSLVVCGALAWVIADCTSFPQPWLPMVACAMSVSVQLAGPWLSPHQRRLQS